MNAQIVTQPQVSKLSDALQSKAYVEYRRQLAQDMSFDQQCKLDQMRRERQQRADEETAKFLGVEGDIIFLA